MMKKVVIHHANEHEVQITFSHKGRVYRGICGTLYEVKE